MRIARFGCIAAICAAAAACGPTPQTHAKIPSAPAKSPPAEPPAIPVKVDARRVPPMAGNAPSARSPILDVMATENKRWFDALSHRAGTPAFYIAYQIHDRRQVVLAAEGGALVTDSDDTARGLDTVVDVGSPQFDNRHPTTNGRLQAFQWLPRIARVPFGADRLAIQHALWLETDRRYREAVLMLRNIKTQTNMIAHAEKAPDFSYDKPHVYVQPLAKLHYDRAAWVKRVKQCSLRAHRGVATRARCQVQFQRNTVYFVNSEGSQIQQSWTNARVIVSVGVKADDGMPLDRTEQAFARTPKGLPGPAEVEKMIGKATTDLDALHDAPLAQPYVGPAILEGRAAGVFFHEVFGHRIEGHRQKGNIEGQTFTSKIGKQIMAPWLTVYDDPTIATLNGTYVNGFYHFDDEGVPAQRAPLVDHGVFKGFVMSRDPLTGFPRSNGHGRKQPGYPPESRQGNLVVEASRSVSQADLEKRLIEEIKAQHKPYGMVFTDISGGVTSTTRLSGQHFEVKPIMAYRVYPDGHRQLVRGVNITGTPLTALGSIVAAGRPLQVFNGMCGAESGWVPVSASAPSLLLSKLEVERKFKPNDRPPLLPPPSVSAGGSR